mmetsp:Transcript_8221/g.25461  ORF Transcript_8221/g.25461 Transcript_8221/m.25461 type:complete len:104 (+) Transcript_8221:251-562(+)
MDIRVQLSGWFEVAARLTAKPKLSISIGEENTSLLHLDADPALSLRESAAGSLLSSKSMPHSPLSFEKPSPSRSDSSSSSSSSGPERWWCVLRWPGDRPRRLQ